jgi:hypothetical protein
MTDLKNPISVNTTCPHCHGQIQVGENIYKCIGKINSLSGCGLIINGVIAGRVMSDFEVESLLKFRHVGPLSGFTARNGRSFSASLQLIADVDGDTLKLEFNFDDASAVVEFHDQIRCSLDDPRTKDMIKYMPVEMQEIVKEYGMTMQLIERSIEASTVPNLVKKKLIKSINSSDISYSLRGVEMPWSQMSRTASMLCGPMFLSSNSPRPNSNNGAPMFPLLQINLSEISTKTHHLFENGLLQIWLSSTNGQCQLRIIPDEELILPSADIFEVSESVFNDALNYIPAAWASKSRDYGIEVVEIKPEGVSMPDIELLLDGVFNLDDDVNFELLNLIRRLVDLKYFLSNDDIDCKVLNIFGYFRSNVYSCWDEDFNEKIFIHSPDWLVGTHNFNLFYSRKEKVNRSFRLSITK